MNVLELRIYDGSCYMIVYKGTDADGCTPSTAICASSAVTYPEVLAVHKHRERETRSPKCGNYIQSRIALSTHYRRCEDVVCSQEFESGVNCAFNLLRLGWACSWPFAPKIV